MECKRLSPVWRFALPSVGAHMVKGDGLGWGELKVMKGEQLA